MSTSFNFVGKQIIIYCATPVFIAGLVGSLLNTLVFLSLKTFRQSSCAFYLTIMSIINIGNLFIGLFSRILTALNGVDDTVTSLVYCKFRLYFNQICIGSSLTCWCLATIDQYFATCSHHRWQQWCNIKLSQRIIIINIISWTLHGIPYILFYDQVISTTTNQTTCVDTNNIFDKYRGFFILLVLIGYLPIIIAAFFGLMAYHNVQQLAYRTVPLVRRELDKQLTVMVLVQVAVSIFTLLPYTTASTVATNKSLTSDPDIAAKLQLAITVTLVFYYITFAVSIKLFEFIFFVCLIISF
jgi:hypothetical protein